MSWARKLWEAKPWGGVSLAGCAWGYQRVAVGRLNPPGAGKSQLGFRALGSPGAHGLFFFLCHAVEAPLEPMSGLALFLIVFFSLVAIVFAIVIGVIVYNKWQEQSRKHFY